MRRFRFFLAAGLAAGVAWLTTAPIMAQCGTAGPVCAQRTTLSANVAADVTVITVASATGFTVGNMVWIDFEQMQIRAISGTSITVARAQNGTAQQAHDSGDGVITGASNHFHTNDPDTGQDCTRGEGQAAYMPWINVRTGWIWMCDNGVTADWIATLKAPRTLGSEPTSF